MSCVCMRVHVRVRVRMRVRVCPYVFVCVRVCQARQIDRHGEFTDTLCLQNKTPTISSHTCYVYQKKNKQTKSPYARMCVGVRMRGSGGVE